MKFANSFGTSVVLEDVSWQGLGNCVSEPIVSSKNFEPVLRNPVDLINATYGQLLSYVVPVVNYLFILRCIIKLFIINFLLVFM